MSRALSAADPVELALACLCFAAAVACCAGSWRSLLLPRMRFSRAYARYSVGSLVNSFVPARAGDVVRVTLFARASSGGVLAVAGAIAVAGTARWLALTPLAAAGTGSRITPFALLAPGVLVIPLAAALVFAPKSRFVSSLRAIRPELAVWIAGTLAARVAGTTLAGTALHVHHPLVASLLVVPALEIAGIVPLTPGNVGIAGGAAALAFHLNGTPMAQALVAGLALHAAELATGVCVGAASATFLVIGRERRPSSSGAPSRPRLLRRIAASLCSEAFAMGRRPVTVE
ncbi:MAG TPA: lysylphosphatidylglycerol synthase domain-containing protein [Gaiellaceae bacterium]|nr:lysylphosphatidylglycerol synthase domain-containing protein [Gaiellaceae bacterium]